MRMRIAGAVLGAAAGCGVTYELGYKGGVLGYGVLGYMLWALVIFAVIFVAPFWSRKTATKAPPEPALEDDGNWTFQRCLNAGSKCGFVHDPSGGQVGSHCSSAEDAMHECGILASMESISLRQEADLAADIRHKFETPVDGNLVN